jgi:hypothetical protein
MSSPCGSEKIYECGKSRQSRPQQSLADQLVDFKALDDILFMLRVMSIRDSQIIGGDDDED